MAEKKPLNLFDDFTINGQFWLPQHPDQKVSGTIEFNGGSEIRLALSGLLGKLEENYGLNFTPEIILGDLDDYRACTLLTNELLALENESKSTFDTRYLLIGKHYPTREEIRLPNLSFELSHLAEWIGSLPVSVRFGDRTKGEPVIFMSCGEAQEWSVKAPASNSTITFESGYKINIDRAKHVHINHTPGIRIQPDGAQDFQSLLRTLGDLQFFMTLLIGTPTETPVYPLRVWSTESEVIQGSGREIPRQVDIYFTLSIGRRNTIGAHDVLLTLPSIIGILHEVLGNWFSNAERFYPVCDLFLGSFYNPIPYPRLQFLTLMQALESFHRVSSSDSRYVNPDRYDEWRKIIESAIPTEVPEDLRISLKGMLRYGNEHSLRKRIKTILNGLPEGIRSLIADQPKAFAGVVVEARNDLTHHGEFRSREITDQKLFNINVKLRALLAILLLREVGIDDQTIEKAFSQNLRFARLRSIII